MSSAIHGYVLELNRLQAERFSSTSAKRQRDEYWGGRSLELYIAACSDGRAHPVSWMGMPAGLATSLRDIGGRFSLGDVAVQSHVRKWTRVTANQGRYGLFISTYHYSESAHELGCKGFGYNKEKAIESTAQLTGALDRVFGMRGAFDHKIFFSIQAGLETDKQALVLHGHNGEIVHLKNVARGTTEMELLHLARRLYPTFEESVHDGLTTMMKANLAHIQRQPEVLPKEEADHKERVLAVGAGFDWLHEPNLALILGPFDNFGQNVETAAHIILKNIQEERVEPSDGILLLGCAPVYRSENDAYSEGNLAELLADNYAKRAFAIIRDKVPDLLPYLDVLVGTIDTGTFRFIAQPFNK